MQQLNYLPIWRDANRLLLGIEQAVRQFPRFHKYALGMSGCRLRSLLAVGILIVSSTGHASQTCRDDIRATAPDSRYQDNGDGTVSDLATGLIWKQCADGLSGAGCSTGSLNSYTWQQALQHAEAHVFAGSALWRLPNKKELASLVEQRCYAPAINSRFFPNTSLDWFWSSSPYADGSDYAWVVGFYSGGVGYSYKGYTGYVRLVRAGQ